MKEHKYMIFTSLGSTVFLLELMLLRACCEIFLLPCVNSHCLFRKRGFDIKWIDDTHALGLFSSPIAGK